MLAFNCLTHLATVMERWMERSFLNGKEIASRKIRRDKEENFNENYQLKSKIAFYREENHLKA